ncbi:PRC-barrel domain-containing protein [Rhodomicrobium sp. Az07]|uniref:PRC-barrel domain-containing protein n=1 Tax=Rhodomicrobium sp. Az07 TaxID=2839034 RepID=UPI001BE64A28|nr:PRC-barrel domain-containing protein [Rhodomicrobium sp. Az07]MBT3072192.1 PRC-barrel domain-containing protein [Rhodomicrobium sp. Az07]
MKSGKHALTIAALGLAACTAFGVAAAEAQSNTGAAGAQATNQNRFKEPLNNLKGARETLLQATGQDGNLKEPRDKASEALNTLNTEIQPMTGSGDAQSQAQKTLSSIKNAQQALSQQRQDPKAMASALQQVEQTVQSLQTKIAQGPGSSQRQFADRSSGASASGQSQQGAEIQVQQQPPRVAVQQAAPTVQVEQPAPTVRVEQPAPTVRVEQPKPQVTINQPKPDVKVQQAKPDVSFERPSEPQVKVEQAGKPDVNIEQSRPQSQSADVQQSRSNNAGFADKDSQRNPIATMRRDEIVGKAIYGMKGQQAGEVADVETSSGGQISAVLLDVGGFLGLGEKRISIPAQDLRFDGNRISSNSMTADQIRNMQSTPNR